MKKYVCMLLMFCMFLGCFAGCNSPEKDPIGSTEQPTESQSETESASETETDTEETLEKIFFSKEDIPGERLEIKPLFQLEHSDLLRGSSHAYRIFNSKEALLQYIEACNLGVFDSDKEASLLQAVEEVDFETYAVIVTVAMYSSGEEPLTLDELILQDERLVFVYESHFAGVTDQNEDHWSTLITVPKAKLSDKPLTGLVCAYTCMDIDTDLFPVDTVKGSVFYFNYYEYK